MDTFLTAHLQSLLGSTTFRICARDLKLAKPIDLSPRSIGAFPMLLSILDNPSFVSHPDSRPTFIVLPLRLMLSPHFLRWLLWRAPNTHLGPKRLYSMNKNLNFNWERRSAFLLKLDDKSSGMFTSENGISYNDCIHLAISRWRSSLAKIARDKFQCYLDLYL